MSYQFCSQIDILASAVGEDEQNFPVALVLTDGRFATTGNGGNVENTDAGGGASGGLTVPADLVVGPNEDGSSEYDFEFVDYNAATGYMEFWVEIVALSSSVDTPVIFAYGDPGVTTSQEDVAGVWDSDYKSVLHMEESGATLADSTVNGKDATKKGAAEPAQCDAQIGKGQDFDGGNDYADFSDGDFNPGTSDFIIETWLRRDGGGQEEVFRAYGIDPKNTINLTLTNADKPQFEVRDEDNNSLRVASDDAITSGATWYYMVGTWDAGTHTAKIYIDAVEKGTGTNVGVGTIATDGAQCLGAWIQADPYTHTTYFDGPLDEFRISIGTKRSTNYITTSHNNEVSPTPGGTFWSALGSEQTRVTKQVSLDAALVARLTKQVSLDADFKGSLTKETSVDVLLKATLARQISLDASLSYRFTKQTLLDAYLEPEIKQASLDALLSGRLTRQTSLDAYLAYQFTKQTSLDAYLVTKVTKQTSLDTDLKDTLSKQTSLDTDLKGTLSKQTSLDGFLMRTFTKQTLLDVLLQGTFSEQVSLDSLLKGTLTKQLSLDLYLTKESGYRVIIYDASGTALARVGDHQNLRVRQRINKTYQLEFDLHRDSEHYQHLAVDNLMQVQRNEVTIFAGIIKKPGPKFGEDGKATRYVHIFAPSFEIREDGRRIEPPSGADYMEVSDNVDDGMKYMVRYNAVTGYVTDAKRILTGLTVEADKAEHPSVKTLTGHLSGGSLLEYLMRWGDAYSVDFWVDADVEAGTYVFRTKYPQRGIDRTVGNAAGNPHTIFSVNRGNILSLDYWEDSFDACSLVYVGGPGEGPAQTIRKVYSGETEPEGNARREHFIGATDAEYDDELEAAGQAYLATWGDPIKGVRFKFQETDSCKYGRDFNLGDLVTVYDGDYGISLDRKIEEIEFALGKDGIEEIILQVGSPEPTQWELFQARLGPYESFSNQVAPATPTGLGYST